MAFTTKVALVFLAATIFAMAMAQTGLCPSPNGDFPNPNSELCTTFFRCIQGNPVLLRCPANKRFDFLFRICRPQRLVDCNNQLQVFAAPATGPGFGGLSGRTGALPGIGAFPDLSSLGGFGGGQLGAGLPNGGLMTLLSQMGGDGFNGSSSNNLATVLMMSTLLNQRNSANQQGSPLSGPGGTVPFYPSNAINPALPPADQGNNANWQQTAGSYLPNAGGSNQGNTITLADGKTYILVPQTQGNYIPDVSTNQFAALIPEALRGQTVFPAVQSQNIQLASGIPKKGDQPQLQNMQALPGVTEAGTESPATVDSSNNTSNATIN